MSCGSPRGPVRGIAIARGIGMSGMGPRDWGREGIIGRAMDLAPGCRRIRWSGKEGAMPGASCCGPPGPGIVLKRGVSPGRGGYCSGILPGTPSGGASSPGIPTMPGKAPGKGRGAKLPGGCGRRLPGVLSGILPSGPGRGVVRGGTEIVRPLGVIRRLGGKRGLYGPAPGPKGRGGANGDMPGG